MVDDLRIAVDIGGTFTDVVLEEDGRRRTRKLLTTPQRPEEAVLEGVRLILADAGRRFADVAVFVHGTTLATNAVIERRGARTALIATEGFRDILDIANESRYDQYDLTIEKPRPLVPRARRLTVPERIDVHGAVRLALDEDAVRAAARSLAADGIESVAVAFMHAYVNPAHERRTREILKEEMPGLWVTLASEVCPEVREYERTSTAVANAYVQPLMDSYLERMQAALAAEGFAGAIYLVTSGGGLTAIETARRYPVRLVESGPAGGAIFAADVAARAGEARALSYDMGGTTAKICLIDDYQPHTARLFEVDRAARFLKGSGLPVRIPVIEMVEIGAGGGSIARLDALKRVTVGPESAGAEPGPACYGRGGAHPAVTDANVVLGTIDPAHFAGGSIALDTEAARGALDRDVAEGLGLSTDMAAYAVYEMVSENMASAARVHAVERGAAIGQYNLIAFGGGAPLHAARVAEKIGVRRVIVPPNAGVGSAVGFLAAPVSYELIRSRYMRLDAFDAAAVDALLDEMSREATALVEPGARGQPTFERRTAFMRYVGQGHEITVELPSRTLQAADAQALREAYERNYAALFERHIPNAAIEILSWSVQVSTEAKRPAVQGTAPAAAAPRPVGRRPVFDGRSGRSTEVPVYRREALPPGSRFAGPAIVAEDETSTYVSASFAAHIDASGCIVMDRKDA
ncbi:hydantoinase/oxoprolinase family protein [Reyranella sp.]|uniref:hydantoinase/oxoprolinase family protein n=1 Tax=Reyranella sp. TaxID=1929291 RepID=UPI003BAD40E7